MCKKLCFLVSFVLLIGLSAGTALGADIAVENYSFEIPGTAYGSKFDIPLDTPFPAGTSGVVTGWARTGPTTSAGEELGNIATNGTWGSFMGKDALIFNTTDFLIMDGDIFELKFDTAGTGTGGLGDNMAGSLYYKDDAGNRVVFATINVDLSGSGVTVKNITLDSDAVGLAGRDHKVGIQFKHTQVKRTSPNIWAGNDWIRLSITTSLMRAQTPSPANESLYNGNSVTLTWIAGPDVSPVDDYRVYFSATRANVASGGGDADRGLTGGAASKSITGLTRNATTAKPYYWRIDTVSESNTYRGNIWSFNLLPNVAYDPVPATGATMVDNNDPVLSWKAGAGAELGHNVYFSKDFNDVNDAATGSTDLPFISSLAATDVNWSPTDAGMPQFLDANNTTYYWRIDEVNSTGTTKGVVWSFTTVPVTGFGKITREIWTGITGGAVANLTDSANYPDSPNQRGTLTTFEEEHSSLVNYGSRVHGYLYIQNTGDYIFRIASGENSQLWLEGEMIAFVDGTGGREGWTNPRQWDKYADQNSAPIPLVGGKSYYIMALHKKGWGYDNLSVAWQGPDQPNPIVNGDPNVIIQGTSLGQFDPSKQVWASYPKPATNATNTEPTILLKWKPGVKATNTAGHDVYFGDNLNAVKDANSLDPNGPTEIYRGRQDPNDYNIPQTLEWGKTYYWRIDEVNDPTIWKGGVWSFTVRNYSVVDSFEDYNNTPGNTIIWQKWKANSTGKAGYSDVNYAELTNIHEGHQSMPFDYNNVNSPYYSDVNRTFDSPQNWATVTSGPYTYHPKSLTLWFRGYLPPLGSFVESPATKYIMTAPGADVGDVRDLRRPSLFHDELHYAYKKITAISNNTRVEIIAKVEDIITNTTASQSAKAGVMFRNDANSNSTEGFVFVMPTKTITGSYRYRLTTGGSTNSDTEAGITDPCWVKLTVAYALTGGQHKYTLRGYRSTDGINWKGIGGGGTPPQPLPETITTSSLKLPLYIGLAVTSHDAAARCTAKFSNVSTSVPVGSATITPATWSLHQDIGIKSNVAAPLYVTLQDSNSPTPVSKTVYHSANPYMVQQQSTWQEWDIPFSDFTGVDLTKVKKITLGVGSATPSGAGTLYFDDIRMYVPRCMANRKSPDFTGSGCLVDYSDFQVLTNNWLVSDYQVTAPVNFYPDTDPNLEARYNLDDNLSDSSVHGRTGDPCGTLIDVKTYVTDHKVGTKALSLNGVLDTFWVPQMVKDDFTLMAWIKTAIPGAAGTRAYQGSGLIWSDVAGDANDFIMAVLDTKLAFATGPNEGETTSSGKVVFNPAQWVHVAVTRTRSSGQVKLYINGMLDRTAIHNNANISLNRNPKINIGANMIDLHYYTGLIDDVRLYSRALSHGEIAQIVGTPPMPFPFTQPLAGLLTQREPAINMYPDSVIDLKDYANLANVWLETLLWP